MDNFNKNIEAIILQEVNNLDQKIRGISFLELLKNNLLEKLEPFVAKLNFQKTKCSSQEFKIHKGEELILVKLIALDKPLSLLKKTLSDDILLISLNEIIKIDIYDSKKSKEFASFPILPQMGVCLTAETNINLNFLKNSFYLEIANKIENNKNINKDEI